MQRLRFACAVLGSASLLIPPVGLACGDKLLAIGRGVRFQRAYSQRPGSVLFYSNGNQGSADLQSAKLQTTLKQAGHKLQTAEGPSQLKEALRLGKVDVVVADFADMAGIAQLLQSAPSKPAVLPVLFKPSKTEFTAAQRDYKFALRIPGDEVQYLVAIDEAMKLRLRIGAKS